MKKIVKVLIVFILILSGNILNVQAYDRVYFSKEIPEKMESITVIRYIDDSHFILVDGEISDNFEFSYLDPTGLTDLYPTPFKGMTVKYAADGYITRILDENNREVESVKNDNMTVPINTYSVDDRNNNILKASWGSNKNRLYRNNYYNCYFGYGRATAYNHQPGQKNHILVKGDVSTSLKYDNITCGLVVKTTIHGKTVNMHKWDAGGLPDAIVDIWKDGVTYWGYDAKKLDDFAVKDVVIEHK